MDKTQAFYQTANNKTALVVFADNPGGYFVIKIDHAGGATSLHPVDFRLNLKIAMDEANRFIADTLEAEAKEKDGG